MSVVTLHSPKEARKHDEHRAAQDPSVHHSQKGSDRCHSAIAIALGGVAMAPLPQQANAATMCYLVWCFETSPASCYGRTDTPHYSRGEASVHGTTNCSRYATYVEVYTELYRNRWYGRDFLDSRVRSSQWNTTSYEATPHASCIGYGNSSYFGYSSHKSVENGKTYTGSTNRTGSFSC
jgi:hypothetical protein